MKCDSCDNEATVHEVTVRNGVKVDRHLCERCAVQAGIAIPGAGTPLELMAKMAIAHQSAESGKAARGAPCPGCGLTFGAFKQSGLLGCPECYTALAAQLMPLIERAHEGSGRHIGKQPRRLSDALGGRLNPALEGVLAERATRLRTVRRMLDDAVRSERFEEAARLRDELRKLNEPGRMGPAETGL